MEQTNDAQNVDTDALKDAQKRAAAAEKEAKELKASASKREADERKAREAAEVRDLEAARAELARYRDQEEKARKEAESYRSMIKAGIEKQLETLPEADRQRVKKYGDKLPLNDWAEFVSEEVQRLGGAPAQTEGDDMQSNDPAPPAAVGGVRRLTDTRGEGRPLHPKTEEVLTYMGQETAAARKGLERIAEPGRQHEAIFVYPPHKLKKLMRERALQPKMLNQENYNKLFG